MKKFCLIVIHIYLALFFNAQSVFCRSATETQAIELKKQWNRSSLDQALTLYSQCYQDHLKEGDPEKALNCLIESGELYYILGEKDQASDLFEKALKLSRTVPDHSYEVKALSKLSLMELDKGDLAVSLNYIKNAEKIPGTSIDPSALASLHFSKAEILYYQRNLAESIRNYQAAVELSQKSGDLVNEAGYLLYLGYAHLANNDPVNALSVLKNSLLKWQTAGEKRGIALTYIAIGHAFNYIDEKQPALEAYSNAENLFPDDVDYIEKGRLLNGVGKIKEDYGDWQSSLDYRKKALECFRKAGHKFGELATLPSVAMLYDQLGDENAALDSLKLARKTAVELNADFQLAIIDEEYGNFYYKKNFYDEAEKYFESALSGLIRINEKKETPLVHTKLARIYLEKGQLAESSRHFDLAAALNEKTRNKFAQADNFFQMARFHVKKNENQIALKTLFESISLSENLSSNIYNSKLQQHYFSDVYDRYELYINLLMKMHKQRPDAGFAVQALQASEKARARSMLETLQLSEANFTKDADPELIKREAEIRSLLNLKSDKLTDLLSSNADPAEIQKLDTEINQLQNEIEELKAGLKKTSPVYSAIKDPAPFDVAEFQNKVMDDDSLLLEFSLGADESYLWLVGKDKINAYVLPPREQLESRVQALRELLASREMEKDEAIEVYQARIAKAETDYWQEAQKLSDEILGPAAGVIKDKRLIVVPDGKLNYFPMSALPFPGSNKNEPLLLTNEVIYEPSASTLSLVTGNEKNDPGLSRDLMLFSDPVFSRDDPRVSAETKTEEEEETNSASPDRYRFAKSLNSLSRLTASKAEADSIAGVIGASKADLFTGFAANRAQLLTSNVADYKIIHFATHGLIDETRPELSGIVLSRFDEAGGKLEQLVRIQDIYGMNIRADLVVLSACNTGIGKEVKGEGLMSLNNAFLGTGARTVVSSLWKVEDSAAVELMKNFYGSLASGNTPPSKALRDAQIKMWQNGRYRSPFYWAAFTVQGDLNQPIPLRSSWNLNLVWIMLGAGILAAGIYWFYRRRKRIYSTVNE